VDPSVLHVLAERLTLTFSASRSGPTGERVPERALFEPVAGCTLLQATCRLGIARELDELEAVAALPLGIQLALRQAIWTNLGRPRPARMLWSWSFGSAHQLELSETSGGAPWITVRLCSPRVSRGGRVPSAAPPSAS
jgi:hypothetical protein